MKENKGAGRALSFSATRRRWELVKHHCWRFHKNGLTFLAAVAVALLFRGRLLLGRRSLVRLWKRHSSKNCRSNFDYLSQEERDFRESRFPSVEERLQLYMGQWYLPPTPKNPQCERKIRYKPIRRSRVSNESLMLIRELSWVYPGNKNGQDQPIMQRLFAIDPIIEPARTFFLHPITMGNCAKAETAKTAKAAKMYMYCQDTNATMSANLPAEAQEIPVLIQFGDASQSMAPGTSKQYLNRKEHTEIALWSHPVFPHFKKFRKAWSPTMLKEMTQSENCPGAHVLERPSPSVKQIVQPIVWKLNAKRHYSKLKEVPCNDRPWSEKKPMAVFRGKLTGFVNKKDQPGADTSDKRSCMSLPRCRLVYINRKSTRVDAKLTSMTKGITDVLDGFNLTGPDMLMDELLEYKALIFVEGNDVSSGLKWGLLSNSIVMMPIPRFTSWAMEELLEPWMHYVPLRDDLADAGERLIWVLQHEQEAARIVRRATLWMLDLVYHPEAVQDEKRVFTEMLRRYARHLALDDKLDQSIG